MQNATALFDDLRDSVRAVKDHLATLDHGNLQSLMNGLSTNVAAGSAEMVILVHLYRAIDAHRSEEGKVILFPAPVALPLAR